MRFILALSLARPSRPGNTVVAVTEALGMPDRFPRSFAVMFVMVMFVMFVA